jgi:hypothetical protein
MILCTYAVIIVECYKNRIALARLHKSAALSPKSGHKRSSSFSLRHHAKAPLTAASQISQRRFENAALILNQKSVTGEFASFAHVPDWKCGHSTAVLPRRWSKSGNDGSHQILIFRTNSASGSLQGLPASRTENCDRQQRVVSGNSLSRIERPVSKPFAVTRQGSAGTRHDHFRNPRHPGSDKPVLTARVSAPTCQASTVSLVASCSGSIGDNRGD